jgi:hypothetical protein
VKKSRQTRAKAIGGTPSMFRKLMLAGGRSDFDYMCMPESDLDVFTFVERVKALNRTLLAPEQTDPRQRCNEATAIGFFISGAVARRKFGFFAKVTSILRYDRKAPAGDRLYWDICCFCFRHNVGDKACPCDPLKLLNYLRARRHRFSANYPTDVPRRLRYICTKLGVCLIKSKRGRPRKNSQR